MPPNLLMTATVRSQHELFKDNWEQLPLLLSLIKRFGAAGMLQAWEQDVLLCVFLWNNITGYIVWTGANVICNGMGFSGLESHFQMNLVSTSTSMTVGCAFTDVVVNDILTSLQRTCPLRRRVSNGMGCCHHAHTHSTSVHCRKFKLTTVCWQDHEADGATIPKADWTGGSVLGWQRQTPPWTHC